MNNCVIVVINGQALSGKDTFVKYCAEYIGETSDVLVHNESTIDPVKKAAVLLGWDMVKDEAGRQFLVDLKQLSIKAYDGPLKYVEKLVKTKKGILFIHVREPQEIDKIVNHFNFPVLTLLIETNRGISEFQNESDQNVKQYNYDYTIQNDSLTEVEESARYFSNILIGLLKNDSDNKTT